MGRKTSVYLSDDLAEAVRASGVPLAELIRRGLDRDALTIRQAVSEALDGAEDRLQELVREMMRDVVREALRQGRGYS